MLCLGYSYRTVRLEQIIVLRISNKCKSIYIGFVLLLYFIFKNKPYYYYLIRYPVVLFTFRAK